MFRYSKDLYNLREMIEIKKSWPEYGPLKQQPSITTGVLLFKGVRYHRTWAILSKQDKVLYLYRSETGGAPHSRVNIKGCTAIVHVAVTDPEGKSKKPSAPRPVPVGTKASSPRPVNNTSIPSSGVRSRDRASATWKGSQNLLDDGSSPPKKVWPPPSSTQSKNETTTTAFPKSSTTPTPSRAPPSAPKVPSSPSSGDMKKDPSALSDEDDRACYLQLEQSGERTMVFLIEDAKDRQRWIAALQDQQVSVSMMDWPIA